MQDQESLSAQGFESQSFLTPNMSISAIISTSCVLLDDSQDTNFGMGGAQGVAAEAVATTSFLANGYEGSLENSIQSNSYQPAEGNPLHPLDNCSTSYMGLDISNEPSIHYASHQLETARHSLNWTNTATAPICANVEEHVGLLRLEEPYITSRSNQSYSDNDWTKSFDYEGNILDEEGNGVSSILMKKTVGREQEQCDFGTRNFSDATCSLEHQEQCMDFLMPYRNCNNFQSGANDLQACSQNPAFDHFDVSSSSHFNHFQNQNSWLQNTNTFENNLNNDNWSHEASNMHFSNNSKTFLKSCAVPKTRLVNSHDPSSDTSSSFCSPSETNEDQCVTYACEVVNPHFAMKTTEIISFTAENSEGEIVKSHDASLEQNTTDTSNGRCNTYKSFLPVHQKPFPTYSGNRDNSGTLYSSNNLGNHNVGTNADMYLNKETNDEITSMDKKVQDSGKNPAKGSKSEKQSCGTQRGKKKHDTAESLQRQLLILEERRNVVKGGVRQTHEDPHTVYDTSKPKSHDQVLVDVDHMICSGVTVAGFKPRATIR